MKIFPRVLDKIFLRNILEMTIERSSKKVFFDCVSGTWLFFPKSMSKFSHLKKRKTVPGMFRECSQKCYHSKVIEMKMDLPVLMNFRTQILVELSGNEKCCFAFPWGSLSKSFTKYSVKINIKLKDSPVFQIKTPTLQNSFTRNFRLDIKAY